MNNPTEMLRLVDSIHRDKDVDKEVIFGALEDAMLSAARKQFGNREEVTVQIDRETGEIRVLDDEEEVDPLDLGRISAQTAKQIIIQRIREAERNVVFLDYEKRVGEIVSGVIQRCEGPTVIVNLGKTEGFLPRREQVRGEDYRPGERIRALVLKVDKSGTRVRITLSRTHPDLIRRLFELEVPEISDHTIEVKALAREPGARTKFAVFSIDAKVDCVGACVGVRGTRIKNIVDELNGEKIDIVRWDDSLEMFVANALRPAEISFIHLNQERNRAVVVVPEDQLALGIGKKGQNVRLASKLVGWEIDIFAVEEFEGLREQAKTDFLKIEGIDAPLAAKLVEDGIYTLHDLGDLDPEYLTTNFEGITPENVDKLQDDVVLLIKEKRRLAEEQRAAESEAARVARAAAAAEAAEAAEAEGAEGAEGEGAPAAEGADGAATAASDEEAPAATEDAATDAAATEGPVDESPAEAPAEQSAEQSSEAPPAEQAEQAAPEPKQEEAQEVDSPAAEPAAEPAPEEAPTDGPATEEPSVPEGTATEEPPEASSPSEEAPEPEPKDESPSSEPGAAGPEEAPSPPSAETDADETSEPDASSDNADEDREPQAESGDGATGAETESDATSPSGLPEDEASEPSASSAQEEPDEGTGPKEV